MVNRVVENFGFFHLVPHSTCKRQVREILADVTKEQIQALGELFVNILYGVLPINESVKEKLRKHKKLFEYLASRTNSIKKRKNLLLKKRIDTLKYIYIYIQL